MALQLQIDEELAIIEITASGILAKSEISAAMSEMNELSQEHGITRILANVSEVEKGPSLGATFAIFNGYPKGLRNAIVSEKPLPPRVVNDLRFVERMLQMRKQPTGLFDSREEAIRWLLED